MFFLLIDARFLQYTQDNCIANFYDKVRGNLPLSTLMLGSATAAERCLQKFGFDALINAVAATIHLETLYAIQGTWKAILANVFRHSFHNRKQKFCTQA